MFTSNPFAGLTDVLSPLVMQIYVVLMILAVAGGTLFDVWHKRSAEFFTLEWRKSRAAARRRLGAGETAAIAAGVLLREVATSGEFCNPRRRASHLLMFYGFLFYLAATLALVFVYPGGATPPVWPLLWNLGALMLLAGGGWFFFLRVDVAYEGHSPFRLVRADLFIVCLLASATLGLAWEMVQAAIGPAAGRIAFALYIFFTTLLFVSVPWSKFAHMFYKPAVAFQRRVEEASGASSLPQPAEGKDLG